MTVKKLKNTMNTQLGLTLRLIKLVGHVPMELSFFIFTFHQAHSENKVQVKVTGARRLRNGLVVQGSFKTRTTSRAIATKFEEEIIRLKEFCIHIDIIVEKLRRRPLFCNSVLPYVCEQLKEDEPRLIRIRTLKAL